MTITSSGKNIRLRENFVTGKVDIEQDYGDDRGWRTVGGYAEYRHAAGFCHRSLGANTEQLKDLYDDYKADLDS